MYTQTLNTPGMSVHRIGTATHKRTVNQLKSQNAAPKLATIGVKQIKSSIKLKPVQALKTDRIQSSKNVYSSSFQSQNLKSSTKADSNIFQNSSISNITKNDIFSQGNLNLQESSNNFLKLNNLQDKPFQKEKIFKNTDQKLEIKHEINSKIAFDNNQAQMKLGNSKNFTANSNNKNEEITYNVVSESQNYVVYNFQDQQFSNAFDKKINSPDSKNSILQNQNQKRRSHIVNALPDYHYENVWSDRRRNYVIGGNWKSNGDRDFIKEFTQNTLQNVRFNPNSMDVCVAPTDIHLLELGKNLLFSNRGDIKVMAQDVSQYKRGAYTGNVAADQLLDIGVTWTITGHSERRSLFNESNEDVAIKTKIALDNGLKVIACVGEQLQDREDGRTMEVIEQQLKAISYNCSNIAQWGNLVIAYEPVWAIGTGKVASPDIAQETHLQIRNWIADNVSQQVAGELRIIYGGSVNGANSLNLIEQQDIDGFLVGGASMKPEFSKIIENAWGHYTSWY